MSTDSVELLPCPFCGHPVTLQGSKNAPDRLLVITCTSGSPCIGSGLGGFYILESQREEGISAWNRRAPIAPSPADKSGLAERVERLEAAVRYARPLLVKYAYTQGNSADFVREITAPVDAVLTSETQA